MQTSFTATATGPVGTPINAGAGKTYRNFNLKVDSPIPDCVVALETSPDDTTWTEVCRVTGPKWAYAASDATAQYARVNVIAMGTGAAGRTDPSCGTSAGYNTFIDALLTAADVGKSVSGSAIPVGANIIAAYPTQGYGLMSRNAATTTSGLPCVIGATSLSAVILCS
jgi:hypothetical protein